MADAGWSERKEDCHTNNTNNELVEQHGCRRSIAGQR